MRPSLGAAALAAALAALALLSSSVQAQPAPNAEPALGINDPTRPPMHGQADQPQPSDGKPVLQSVLIAPNRKVAVIDGQNVREGQWLGKARVVRISEDRVLLQGPQGKTVLHLFPGIEKQRTVQAADAPAAKNTKRKTQ